LNANPEGVPTIYDPAIQESGVLFGGRGLESALSAFDPRWTTSMIWGRDERVQNNAFFSGGLPPGNTLIRETGDFSTRLQKLFADGGSFAVTHDWMYQGVNVPGQLFPSSYTGSIGAEYRMPLLAGAGTEYTRIAGPIANSFGGITGVTQGVVITRINNDISLADFELSVRNLVKDVEFAYWDLYLQYRLYDTAVKTRNSTLEIWRTLQTTIELGGRRPEDITNEPQAREQYFETRAAAATALGNVYRTEVELRRLLGMPSNEGVVLRPIDEPPLAEFALHWETSLVEALTNRPELRRQKFNIKSLELQLQAAHSLVRPRLDFVSGYRVNGFGDKLLSQKDDDGRSPQGLNSAYETITQGDQTAWNLGFEMTMDIGFRSAHAQVRNIELRLAKARDILAAQELDVSHELTAAFQNMATNYATAQANFNRLRASEERIDLFQKRAEITDVDLELRAQLSRALAEAAFYTNLTDYAKSITAIQFAKGTGLEFNNVHLAESMWTPQAYDQALRRAIARSHAIGNPFLETEPEEFVYPGGEHIITVERKDAPTAPEGESLPGQLPEEMKSTKPMTEGEPQLTPVLPPQPTTRPYEAPKSEPVPALPKLPPMPENNVPPESAKAAPSAPPTYQSSNLERLRMRNAKADNAASVNMDLSGTKTGTLKTTPAKYIPYVDQAGFFTDNSPEKQDSLELDEKDLLQ
jgi:outer membrane protein TolC